VEQRQSKRRALPGESQFLDCHDFRMVDCKYFAPKGTSRPFIECINVKPDRNLQALAANRDVAYPVNPVIATGAASPVKK
jgi:hypothetical protein